MLLSDPEEGTQFGYIGQGGGGGAGAWERPSGAGIAIENELAAANETLNEALDNPSTYAGADYDTVYRKLVDAAKRAGWQIRIARNGRGITIIRPGTTNQIRVMVPSPDAPPGTPPTFYRIVVGKAHVNLRP
jgi:hypothetical protein